MKVFSVLNANFIYFTISDTLLKSYALCKYYATHKTSNIYSFTSPPHRRGGGGGGNQTLDVQSTSAASVAAPSITRAPE